ncbi:MAG: chaperonin GroEL [SAR202 cluster bacterium]|nr:chaperonin GroEL [SAR202 cluster bacterium]|tara:strand:- start:9412 stop:11013 length:1602 start_codon:yes stop_codon:yes gene_type:complete
MPKQFQFREDAREQLMEGIDIMARTVGATLGPNGRNVVIEQEFGPPQVCSDGVTIAKEIELEEPFHNMGAQLLVEAASKTNDDVGDGTTTSTILAQAMLKNGFRNIAAGADPMLIKQGMLKAVESMVAELKAMSKSVTEDDQISQIAVLSAHDEEMGKLVGSVINKVGKDGVISVEQSPGIKYEVDFVEGMEIDRGYLSPYFVTDQDKMITELNKPYILITSEKIESIDLLVPFLEKFSTVGSELVIIAEDIEGQALATLVVNKMRGTINCLGVKAPAFGDRRKAILEDMAILFGANVISNETGRTFDSIEISDLGRCRRVTATKDTTTFVEGDGNQSDIDARISNIKSQVSQTTSDYDKEKLEERAAKLSGGVSVIKVGAPTEVELKEKRQRLEDALSATRAAMEEGILPGGGSSLVRAAEKVYPDFNGSSDIDTGARVVLDSVSAPLALLVENAGFSGSVVVDAIKNGTDDYGFDAETNRYGSMYEYGIIDPVKVTRSALENAASISAMVLTTESLITELNPPKLPAPFDD